MCVCRGSSPEQNLARDCASDHTASIKRGYKGTRYAGMTSDCTMGGLCEIFMRD